MFEVSAEYTDIVIVPQTELEEIYQNVRTILLTTIGTVPLDRNFGIDRKILDLPISVVHAKLNAALVRAVNRFEPRARVVKISYEQRTDETLAGTLRPKVHFELVKERLRGYVLIE